MLGTRARCHPKATHGPAPGSPSPGTDEEGVPWGGCVPGSQAHPWGSSRREGRGLCQRPAAPHSFFGVRLSRELGVLKKINFLILR